MEKPKSSMAIQILPQSMDKQESIKVIDKVIENIKQKGLKIEVCPFETVIEGDFLDMIDILKESFEISEKNGAKDIFANVKLAYNNTGVLSIDEKISKHR